MKKNTGWEPVHHNSGSTTVDKTVGNFRASIFKVDANRYVYNVTTLNGSLHKRGTTSSLGGAKAAASRLLTRLGAGKKIRGADAARRSRR